MELTYNKPLKIVRFIKDDLMELEDDSVVRFLAKRPESWKPGDQVILRKNTDPKPGGPRQMQFNNLVTATNVKGGDPQPITGVKSPNLPDQPVDMNKNYTLDDVKTHKEYKILEIYPEQDSFRLPCGKFIIDKLSILKGKRFEYGEDDIIVFYPAATVTGGKDKFRAVNTSRSKQVGQCDVLVRYFD